MVSFFKKDDESVPSEQDALEILENTTLIYKLIRNTEVEYLDSRVIWQQAGDFKFYRSRIDLGSGKEIVLELGRGKRDSRMSLSCLYLNISTPLVDFQIAEPSFVGLPVKRRYRHEHDQRLAEAMKNLVAVVQQQVLKRSQEGDSPESRRRARGLCLDRLLSS